MLVAGREGWHPGVVGLVAARLKERFGRPAFAIAWNGGGIGTGSGRSIAGVDIGAAVRAAVEAGILVKGGGHAMAAGITVARERLAELRAFLEERLAPQVQRGGGRNATSRSTRRSRRAARRPRSSRTSSARALTGTAIRAPVFAFPAHRVTFADTRRQRARPA